MLAWRQLNWFDSWMARRTGQSAPLLRRVSKRRLPTWWRRLRTITSKSSWLGRPLVRSEGRSKTHSEIAGSSWWTKVFYGDIM